MRSYRGATKSNQIDLCTLPVWDYETSPHAFKKKTAPEVNTFAHLSTPMNLIDGIAEPSLSINLVLIFNFAGEPC